MKALRNSTRHIARRQEGLTLVELLVALAISLLIALAAVVALVVSRQGFTAVDAASQLRDNGRFVSDIVQRLGVQTGYKDVKFAKMTDMEFAIVRGVAPAGATPQLVDVSGFNNKIPSNSDPINTALNQVAGGGNSDVLILRYQAAETYPKSGVVDSGFIDCAGIPVDVVPADRADRSSSILHVAVPAAGTEPSLMCTRSTKAGGFTTQPLIQGVETFQVLYGTDGVVPNTAPVAGSADSVPERYLNADQMVVPGNPAATSANWNRVRSLRIGMVLRGPLGSSSETKKPTLYPFGLGKASATAAPGSAFYSGTPADDPGAEFTPKAADTRLRQTVTFTVHLRNDQSF